jgi:hypothetical protein
MSWVHAGLRRAKKLQDAFQVSLHIFLVLETAIQFLLELLLISFCFFLYGHLPEFLCAIGAVDEDLLYS